MGFLIKYLKYRIGVILSFILFCGVFAVSLYLYNLPIKAVMYPTLICGLFCVMIIVKDFTYVKNNHKKLTRIADNAAGMVADMPKTTAISDEDYQKIIQSLIEEIRNLENNYEMRYNDMNEYYSAWVHQIKTPISAMRLNLENEDTELSRRLTAELVNIERYVEMVMVYLRLDSITSDYVFKEHSIDAMVRQTVKKMSGVFIAKRLALNYQISDMTVVTDEKWFCFVLEQILSNALKYTSRGGIKIYTEKNTLHISDTGIGIAPEDLPRVFEKGYTGYNGRYDKKASGIGLYLCRRICKNLGCDIKASSEIGAGTDITITFSQDKTIKE